MPRKKSSGIEVTQVPQHVSKMSAKILLGKDYDPTKHYHFARQDNVEFKKEAQGYEPTAKRFKEMVLMQTSKENFIRRQEDNKQRTKARSEALDRSVEREVDQSGKHNGKSMVYFTKA